MALVVVVLLALGAVAAVLAGIAYGRHIARRPPHDLRDVGAAGLPSDVSIRSGELGRGAAGGLGHGPGP